MKSNKRTDILNSALKLFITYGFNGTSTAKIALDANVATGTLFHHFSSKQKLFDELYLTIKNELADVIQSTAHDKDNQKGWHFWFNALDWAVKNPLKIQMFNLYHHSEQLSAEVQQQIILETFGFLTHFIEGEQQAGLFSQLPVDLVVIILQGIYLSTAQYLIDNPECDIKLIIESSYAMFMNSQKIG